MPNLDALSPGKKLPDEINVLVEIPKGSSNKYEFDKESGFVFLDRVLFSPFHYPADYGFVPKTLAQDGDPLDALVLMNAPTLPGVVIPARPVGVLGMVDSGDPDDKVLCVPKSDPRFNHIKDINDVPKPILDEIGHFFVTYKQLEGKTVTIGDWRPAAAAKELVIQSRAAYEAKA
jgi:inorganic pyrophosphatase